MTVVLASAPAERLSGARLLRSHWSASLDAADRAIDASRRARTLPVAYCLAELARVRDERHWLERVELGRPRYGFSAT